MLREFFRRLRGALGNALVWALGWAGISVVFSAALSLIGLAPPVPFWRFAIPVAQSFAGVGFLSGGAFSVYLGIAGRKLCLEELSAGRFAVGGGIAAGLLIPAFAVVVNGAGGFPVPVGTTVIISAVAATLAGLTAFGTIRIAQGASRRVSDGYVGKLEAEQDEVLSLLGKNAR